MTAGSDARAALDADLDREAALTRTLLDRVPDASLPWTPHARALTLGALASHIAELPHWGAQILGTAGYDFDRAAGAHRVHDSVAAVREVFDRHVADLRRDLAAAAAADLDAPWTLRRGTRVISVHTRLDAVRLFALHHLLHHRGQLAVYLRLLDVPLPPIYGPSADEQP